jgi:hypothetical protein
MFSNPTRFCGFRHRDGHAADLWVLAEVASNFWRVEDVRREGRTAVRKEGVGSCGIAGRRGSCSRATPGPAGAMSPWFFRLSVRSSLASSGRTCSTRAAPRTTLSGSITWRSCSGFQPCSCLPFAPIRAPARAVDARGSMGRHGSCRPLHRRRAALHGLRLHARQRRRSVLLSTTGVRNLRALCLGCARRQPWWWNHRRNNPDGDAARGIRDRRHQEADVQADNGMPQRRAPPHRRRRNRGASPLDRSAGIAAR